MMLNTLHQPRAHRMSSNCPVGPDCSSDKGRRNGVAVSGDAELLYQVLQTIAHFKGSVVSWCEAVAFANQKSSHNFVEAAGANRAHGMTTRTTSRSCRPNSGRLSAASNCTRAAK